MTNPFLQMYEDGQKQANSLNSSMAIALDRNPDEESFLTDLSKSTGIPVETLRLDKGKSAKKSMALEDVQSLPDRSPATAAHLADPNRAAMANDDIHNLEKVESQTGILGQAKKFLDENVFRVPITQSLVQYNKGVGGMYQWMGDTILQPLIDAVASDDMKQQYGQSNLLTIWGKQMQEEANLVQKQIDREHPVDPNSWSAAFRGGMTSTFQQLPTMLVGGGMANTVQQATAMTLLPMGVTTAGQTYGEKREAGLDPFQAGMAAAGTATVEVGTELFPTGKMFELMKPAAKMSVAGVFKKVAEIYGSEIIGESVATFFQDVIDKVTTTPNMSTQEVIDSVSDYVTSGEAWQNFTNTLKATLVQSSVMAGGGAGVNQINQAVESRQQKKAEAAHQSLMDTFAAAEASRLANRSPESFTEFVQRAGDQHGIDTVYLQSDRLIEEAQKQGWTQDELVGFVEQYGVTQEELNTAIASGSNLELDYGQVVANIKTDDALTLFQNDLTIDPNISTKANAENAAQASTEHMVRLAELYQSEQEKLITPEDVDNWKQAILQTEGLKGRVTEQHLDLMAATANTYSKLSGMPAIDLLNKMLQPGGLQAMKFKEWEAQKKEQQGEVLGQNMLPTDTPEFKNWFEGSKVVDEQGKPLVVYHGTGSDFDTFQVGAKGTNSTTFGSDKTAPLFDPVGGDVLFQSAYHGTPHTFDKFSLSAIGTGEGAQAYGWGLYFAESQEIAEWYRKNLSSRVNEGDYSVDTVEKIQRLLSKKLPQLKELFDLQLSQNGIDYDSPEYDKLTDTIIEKMTKLNRSGSEELDMVLGDAIQAFDTFDKYKEFLEKSAKINKGRLYKVELAPAEDEYLLWDKPLSEQSEKVRGVIASYLQSSPDFDTDDSHYRLPNGMMYSTKSLAGTKAQGRPKAGLSEMFGVPEDKIEELSAIDAYLESLSGSDFYIEESQIKGSDKAASEYLHSLGIRGIKYLDGTSRSGKRENYNYVIFSDDDVAITEMYQKQNANPLGALQTASGENIITLFEKSDKSTFLHEVGHIYLNFMREMADKHGIQTDVWNSTKEWLGVKDDGVITRDMHEKFAEHFEVYLMEGTAPTPALREAFRSFKRWLTNIYESIKSGRFGQRQDITITPEVEAIFSRLLATEQEIQSAKTQAALVAMLDDKLLNSSGFTQEQIDEYLKVSLQSDDSAREKMDNHKLVGRKERLAGFKEQATREAGTVPVYGFIDWATNKENPQPINRESIVNTFGKDVASKLPKSPAALWSKDGLNVDHAVAEVGEQFGYESAADLVADLTSMQPRQQWIEKRVAQLEVEHDMSQETEEAIRTASLRKMLEIESQWLAKQVERSAKEQAKKEEDYNKAWKEAEQKLAIAIAEGKKQEEIDKLKDAAKAAKEKIKGAFAQAKANAIPLAAIKEWAKGVVAGRDMKRISNIGKMLAESRQHRQKAIMLAKKQEWEGALKENEQARMTEALIAESYKARNEFQKQQKAWNKAINSKSMDFDYQQQLWRMMVDFGATNRNLDIREETPNITTFFTQIFGSAQDDIDALGLPVVPDWMLTNPVQLKEMTWEQIQDFDDMVAFLHGRGADIKNAVMADGKTLLADAKDACLEAADDIKRNRTGKSLFKEGTMLRKGQDWVRGYMARNRILLFTFRHMDGFSNQGKGGKAGPSETYIWSPMNEGGKRKLIMNQAMAEKVQPHIDQLLKRSKEEFNHVALPDEFKRQNRTWTWERIVSVALNMGNSGNMARVMNGFHINEESMSKEDLIKLTSVLSEADWKAVQGIWDAIDTLYPELNAVHKRINHFPMKKIKAESITVMANGNGTDRISTVNVDLQGGYYPIKFDPSLDLDVAQWTEKDDILNRTEALRQVPNPKSGMTKNREGGAVQRPVMLSLSVLGGHIEDVVNYITMAEAVRDADRITRNKEYRTRAQEVLGFEGYEIIRPNLKGIIRPEATQRTEIERWIEKSRALTSMYAMGYNAWTALQNITGVFPMVRDIGWKAYLNGLETVAKKPTESYRTMMEMSPYMRMRMNNFDRDIKKQLMHFKPEFSVKGLTVQDIRDAGFWGIKAVDMANALPCWWGAYNDALGQGMQSTEAVKFADAKIQSSQGSGNAIDLSMHQRAQGVTRLFTNFMTFAITQQNVLANDLNAMKEGKISKGEYMYGLFMVLILPAVASTMMKSLITKGEPPEPDELGFDILSYLFAGFPFLREIINAKSFKPGEYRGKLRAASLEGTQILSDVTVDAGRAAYEIVTGGDTEKATQKLIWDAAQFGSWASGIPAAQLFKKWQRGQKQIDESNGHWWNLLIPDAKVKLSIEEMFD